MCQYNPTADFHVAGVALDSRWNLSNKEIMKLLRFELHVHSCLNESEVAFRWRLPLKAIFLFQCNNYYRLDILASLMKLRETRMIVLEADEICNVLNRFSRHI